MAKRKSALKRYDSNHIVLNCREYQRKDGMYLYKYKNNEGEKKVIYSSSLKGLRVKEREILRALDEGVISRFECGVTVNDIFALYMQGKLQLKQTTRNNYIYLYDKFVREDLGKNKISEVKYTHIKKFYQKMIIEKKLQIGSLEIIHTILHSVFDIALRDDLVRKNPTEGVLSEIKKEFHWKKPKKHALTHEEQKAFISFVGNSKVYRHWLPLFTVLLGTGCRIGEVIGLTWKDCDFENNMISINHNMVYRKEKNGKYEFHIGTPKTESGKRKIPMLSQVREVLLEVREEQKEKKFPIVSIDGYMGFVFLNRNGFVHNPSTINRSIEKIIKVYNKIEKINAKNGSREPVFLPHFSVHSLRHTFCSRYCENETNIKVIQEIMGHSDISTTMNIYAEVTEKKKKESFHNLEGKIMIC